jgi:phosphoribosylanthranilate isomerase
MKKTWIQIYEVQKPAEAGVLVSLGVDHIGSVLVSEDRWKQPVIRRTVQAVQSSGAKSGIIPISKDPVKIFAALDYYRPDFVHLCDTLSPFPMERQTQLRDFDAHLSLQIDLKDRFPQIDIMRSLSVVRPGLSDAAVIQKNVLDFAHRLAPFSDFFLIDTLLSGASQPVEGFVGITGETCDWTIAKAVIDASPIPVILAGGISDENVYDAIIRLRPAGVDSCTKTNAVDRQGRPVRFKKDMKKVLRLVEEARRADAFLRANDTSGQDHAEGI